MPITFPQKLNRGVNFGLVIGLQIADEIFHAAANAASQIPAVANPALAHFQL
jgi:hypothetical protein